MPFRGPSICWPVEAWPCPRAGAVAITALLSPPLGQREWRCSFLPAEGFQRGSRPGAPIILNASELALLQRLQRAPLPRRRADGNLMGPLPVWLRLLHVLRLWLHQHLQRQLRSLSLLEQVVAAPGGGR